jgi:Leucine-rich repeat (LRR) protein
MTLSTPATTATTSYLKPSQTSSSTSMRSTSSSSSTSAPLADPIDKEECAKLFSEVFKCFKGSDDERWQYIKKQKFDQVGAIDVQKSKLCAIPSYVQYCSSLSFMHLSGGSINRVPEFVRNLVHLSKCNFEDNALQEIPSVLLQLPLLTSLNLSHNKISSVSSTLLPPLLQELFLDHNGLEKFEAVTQRAPYSLVTLNISNNLLSVFPSNLHQFQHLKILNASKNAIRAFTGQTKLPPTLETLNLSYNQIVEIEDCLGKIPRAKLLDFSHNRIERLPYNPVWGYQGNPPKTTLPEDSLDSKALRHHAAVFHTISTVSDPSSTSSSSYKLEPVDTQKTATQDDSGSLALDLSDNNLTEFPDQLKGIIKNIRWLKMCNNKITKFANHKQLEMQIIFTFQRNTALFFGDNPLSSYSRLVLCTAAQKNSLIIDVKPMPATPDNDNTCSVQ